MAHWPGASINPLPSPDFIFRSEKSATEINASPPGNSRVVNLTDYKEGYTIFSLEESKSRPAYSTLIQVLGTLDEGIMDQILTARRIPFTRLKGQYVKYCVLICPLLPEH